MTLTKTKFRESCLKKLTKLPKHNKLYRDKLLNTLLVSELKSLKSRSILFYIPFSFEVNIKHTLMIMRRKCNIYTPFMEGQSFKMVLYRLPLTKKKFGIYEAGNTFNNRNKIDTAIVPILGVDSNLQRVGFGKGMYDRFFEKLKKKPYTIFIQPELCYTKEKVCDTYDISCDMLLTPKNKIINKRKNRI